MREIYGIKWGYRGFYEDFPNNWINLNIDSVRDIHKLGGTILGSSRGGFDAKKITKAILDKGIN